ncbi:MAG: CotH kinase family protein [Candidatus Delongbacteria bacterium]|nr:CotH kinase family protein [Candidatus Delongbacteria bacterium]MBN2833567.1 CotH kinase family protein [Candidatus Delongbacteria bacterium]
MPRSFFLIFLLYSIIHAKTLEIDTINQIYGANFLPVVYTIIENEERVLTDFDTLSVVINGELLEDKVIIYRGLGSITLENIPENDFSVGLEGYTESVIVKKMINPDIVILEGELSEDIVLSKDNVYKIINDLYVPKRTKMSIQTGCNIIISEDVNIEISGSMSIMDSDDDFVFFSSESNDIHWGGLRFVDCDTKQDLKKSFFISGGGNPEFNFGHSLSQPVIYIENSNIDVYQCYLIDNPGKGFGLLDSELNIYNTLISRCDTGGQENNSTVKFYKSDILEIPDSDHLIDDDDNDGFYFSGGVNCEVNECNIILTEDDAIDHNGADLKIVDCWISDIYHEGVASSNINTCYVYNTYFSNCDNGVEAGYGAPEVIVDHCTFEENNVGIKFGDSYDWGCTGTLTVTNSICYNNGDNIHNFDIQTNGPVEGAIDITYSITNDSEYDNNISCFSAIPELDSLKFIVPGSPGYGRGYDRRDLGLTDGSIISSSVKEFFIDCDPEEFEYIYEHYEEDIYIPVKLTYNGNTWNDTQMRIRGDSSRLYPKKSLKIKFDQDLFEGDREAINLNSEWEDITYMRQYLSVYLIQQNNYPNFNVDHAIIYLNNEFFGIYLLVENMDNDFLNNNNLNSDGNLYKASKDGASLSIFDDVNYHWEKKTNENSGREDLQELINKIDECKDDNIKEFLLTNFDYNKLIDVIATNILISNGSTYYHNYYMLHDSNDKWQYLHWDMDKTFDYSGGLYLPFLRTSNSLNNDNPLIEKALRNEDILDDVFDRIEYLDQNILKAPRTQFVIDSLKNVLSSYISLDQTDQIENNEDWIDNIDNLNYFINNRFSILQNQKENLPSNFELYRIDDNVLDNVKLRWEKSKSNENNSIFYNLTISPDQTFQSNETVMYTNLTDTVFTLSDIAYKDKYYWTVEAINGSYNTQGFDSRNFFNMVIPTIVPDIVDYDFTMTKSNSPYYFDKDVLFTENSKLFVEAGVEIIIKDSVNIKIMGEFVFNGKVDDTIKIHNEASGFGKFVITQNKNNNFFSYTNFDFPVNSYMDYNYLFSIEESFLSIRNCKFNTENSILYVENSEVIIDSSYFNEVKNIETFSIKSSKGKILNSIFNVRGEIDLENCYNFEITQNMMYYNSIEDFLNDDGIDLDGCNNIVISSNNIRSFPDKGISIGNSTGIFSEYNIIEKCNIGSEIKNDSSVEIDHNTFYGNNISIEIKNVSNQSIENLVLTNSILSSSNISDIVTPANENISISYCLSTDSHLIGISNIYGNPLFADPINSNYALSLNSPCIDSGDPEYKLDIDGSKTDIGAIPFRFSKVVINEINYHSLDNYDTGDWIEIYNPNEYDVSLNNWSFADSDSNKFIIKNINLKSKEFLVLFEDSTLFLNNVSIENSIGPLKFALKNSGEEIYLFNESNIIVDNVLYDDESPWPTEADGLGYTLELKDPELDNFQEVNWLASKRVGGTPGKINSSLIKDIEKNKLTCFPNPFEDIMNIKVNLVIPETFRLKIFNVYGQSLLDEEFMMDSKECILKWDAKMYSSGVYFITLEIDAKIMDLFKIVKVK